MPSALETSPAVGLLKEPELLVFVDFKVDPESDALVVAAGRSVAPVCVEELNVALDFELPEPLELLSEESEPSNPAFRHIDFKSLDKASVMQN